MLFTLVCVIFAATSYDSSSYTLAASATEELPPTQHPARWHRVFWAFLLGLLPITLVYLGGLKPLQSAVTLVSVPLFAVIDCSRCRYLNRYAKIRRPVKAPPPRLVDALMQNEPLHFNRYLAYVRQLKSGACPAWN
ncbi:MAG: hypothetical protein CM15mP120_30300 [Pseudomonadota bacterium]|nr:MAG: hypothetical protein CM15mP120_30300 [Pseudomonadota bacterium]